MMAEEEPDFVYSLYDHATDTQEILELTDEVKADLDKRLHDIERCRVAAMTAGNSYILWGES